MEVDGQTSYIRDWGGQRILPIPEPKIIA